ncbi:MAG: hypothetical protein KO202_04560 [Methanobacteriaceae archaeon]|nr:hypothetical protein [Methanobacteriaceae archaeon]
MAKTHITQKNQLTEDTKLFRGIEYSDFMENWFKNRGINENGFSSTSFNKDIVFKHVNKNLNNDGWIIEIDAPKNTQGGYLEQYSAYAEELEFLLPRNSTFEILNIDFENREIKTKIKNIYNIKNKIKN